ncbi:MAG TPA: maleylpyruvate isomerase N-terminal domain-containing protein [Acidimicrobiales bacterium]
MGTLAPVDPVEVRRAIAAVGARVSAMVRAISHPDAPCLGIWNTTDVAVHLSHGVDIITSLARGSSPMSDDIWDLMKLMPMLVTGESERDLGAIATRIDASVASLLAVLRDSPGDPSRQWVVEGVDFPLTSIASHALNELVVHGGDVARADGAPWPVDRPHAALVLRGFMFPVLGALRGAMVDQEAAAGVKATYHIVLRGGGHAYLRFDDGDLSVSDDPPGPVDCHLSVDPAAFLAVGWARTTQWPPIFKGKLLAYGRKPWMGLKLRGMLRNP